VRLPLRVSPAPVYGGGGTMRLPHAPITASRVSGASGGIGRRAGFRFLWGNTRGGSSPPSPTPRVVPSRHSRPHSFGPLRRGCRRPTTWCDAHHLISWWERQGPTDFDNSSSSAGITTPSSTAEDGNSRHRHPPHLHPTRRHDPPQRPATPNPASSSRCGMRCQRPSAARVFSRSFELSTSWPLVPKYAR